MPRYFLHANRTDGLLRDYAGAEFADADAALGNAVLAARLLFEMGEELGEDRGAWSLTVTDDTAREIGRISLAIQH